MVDPVYEKLGRQCLLGWLSFQLLRLHVIGAAGLGVGENAVVVFLERGFHGVKKATGTQLIIKFVSEQSVQGVFLADERLAIPPVPCVQVQSRLQ